MTFNEDAAGSGTVMSEKTWKLLVICAACLGSNLLGFGITPPINPIRETIDRLMSTINNAARLNDDDEPDFEHVQDVMFQMCDWICEGHPLETFDISIVRNICTRQTEIDEVREYKDALNKVCSLHQAVIEGTCSAEGICQYLNKMANLVDEGVLSSNLTEYFLFDTATRLSGGENVEIPVLNLILRNWRARRTPEVLVEKEGIHFWKNSLQDEVLRSFLHLYDMIAEVQSKDLIKKILATDIVDSGHVWLFLFSSAKDVLIKSLEDKRIDGLGDIFEFKTTLPNGKAICLKDVLQFSPKEFEIDPANGIYSIREKRNAEINVDAMIEAHNLFEKMLFDSTQTPEFTRDDQNANDSSSSRSPCNDNPQTVDLSHDFNFDTKTVWTEEDILALFD